MGIISSREREERIERLSSSSGFFIYLKKFDEAFKKGKFSGQRREHHFKTIDRLNALGLLKALEDNQFLDCLYDTVNYWVGRGWLVNRNTFKKSLHKADTKKKIVLLHQKNYRLIELAEDDLNLVTNILGNLLSNVKISQSSTQLVAGSKTIHHLLPQLVPPIDREHTIRFFYYKKGYCCDTINLPYLSDKRIFNEIFPSFCKIGSRNCDIIQERVEQHKLDGSDFHTSETKVIDNAIIGFVLKELK